MNITERYRPKTLDKVLGQSHIVKSLGKIIEERKHSTFLFEGPSGTGKTTLRGSAPTCWTAVAST